MKSARKYSYRGLYVGVTLVTCYYIMLIFEAGTLKTMLMILMASGFFAAYLSSSYKILTGLLVTFYSIFYPLFLLIALYVFSGDQLVAEDYFINVFMDFYIDNNVKACLVGTLLGFIISWLQEKIVLKVKAKS